MENECLIADEPESFEFVGNETYCQTCRRIFIGGTMRCTICGTKDLMLASLAFFERCGVCKKYPIADSEHGVCVGCYHALEQFVERIDCYRTPEAFEV